MRLYFGRALSVFPVQVIVSMFFILHVGCGSHQDDREIGLIAQTQEATQSQCVVSLHKDPNLLLSDEEKQEIESLKVKIKEEFGIEMRDGNRGWSHYELVTISAVLANLPKSFSHFTAAIVKELWGGSSRVLGFMTKNDEVTIFEPAKCNITGTLVHEMGHAFYNMNPAVIRDWKATFWGSDGRTRQSPSPSRYGNTNAAEDFAESVRLYYVDRPFLKKESPSRYNFIAKRVMGL